MNRLLLTFLFMGFPFFAETARFDKRVVVAPEQKGIFHLNNVAAGNTITDEILVIWEKRTRNNSTLQGRRVSSEGKLLSGIFTISRLRGASNASLVFNAVKNEFGLAFDDNLNNTASVSNVYFVTLNAQGRPTGAASNMTTDPVSSPMRNRLPQLVALGDGNYDLFWNREVATNVQLNEGNNGLVGVHIPANTALTRSRSLAAPKLLKRTVFDGQFILVPFVDAAAYNPVSKKIHLAVIQAVSNTQGRKWNYFLGTLSETELAATPNAAAASATFSKVNKAPVVLGNNILGADLAIFPSGVGLVAFVDSKNMKLRRIDSNGRPAGGPFDAFNGPSRNEQLSDPAFAVFDGQAQAVGKSQVDEEALLSAIHNLEEQLDFISVRLSKEGKPLSREEREDLDEAFEALEHDLAHLESIRLKAGIAKVYRKIRFNTFDGEDFVESDTVEIIINFDEVIL